MAYEGLSWPQTPSSTDLVDPGSTYNMGIRFHLNTPATCVGVRWRVPDSVSTPPGGTHVVSIWTVAGETRIATENVTPTPGGDQDFLFTTPVALSAATNYVAAVHTQHYVFRASGGTWPSSPSGNIVSDESRLTANDAAATYPSSAGSAWYYVSPLIQTSVDPDVVAPDGLAVPVTFGSPTIGVVGVAPTGLSVPVTFGLPATEDGPPVVSTRAAGGWDAFGAALRFNADEARREREAPPVDCPNDGEPLQAGPGGVLHCPADGWQWPAKRVVSPRER